MADNILDGWQKKSSSYNTRHHSETKIKEQFAAPLNTLWAGISIEVHESANADIAIAVHDGTALENFCVKSIRLEQDLQDGQISNHVVTELRYYEHSYFVKFIGAGFSRELKKRSPSLTSRLWLELDVVPISLMVTSPSGTEAKATNYWHKKQIDEQANSMVRKCILHFGPKLVPLLEISHKGMIKIDSGFQANIANVDDYRKTVSPQTWEAMKIYSDSLAEKGYKIAFFSSTPQGGGVALMRHALVRLAHLLGVDLKWYVPKPKPGVFRITKKMHNILQGVRNQEERISSDERRVINEWIEENANRYWLSAGGPLQPPSEGGANIIIIDDPQMPRLISLVKDITPGRPVLFRSHIQIRSDLVDQEGSPQAEVWKFLWSNIKRADMFISHPISSFVPNNIPREKVAYMPATTDWLDGLNKNMSEWDQSYYRNLYNKECSSSMMTQLATKKYIIQIARFDPSKGIGDAIKSYAEFRRLLKKHNPEMEVPQLVIAGQSSIDDPESTQIYDETMNQLETKYPHLVSSVSMMHLSANDQLLNSLLSGSHIALQLSTREGFEVKVSEAIHKGKPIIATKTGGIPLQVQDRKNGFLVDAGDSKAVAWHIFDLWTDDKLYKSMSQFAEKSISDEVGTVGNAMAWFYLADKWVSGEGVDPEGRWINDLAREAAGKPYGKGENKLPR